MKHRRIVLLASLVALCLAFAGCAHTSRVALLSDGNLEGKHMTGAPAGRTLEGEDCGGAYYLANAFRDAIEGTDYDTLVDVEVTSTAGLTPFNQCLKVKGRGAKSADLPRAEEAR